MTQCTAQQLEFQPFGQRKVTASFDGEQITTHAGGLLLREADLRIGLMDRLAECFVDYRHPGRIEHSVRDLVSQRVYALALGYEDLNDHDALMGDTLLALMVGKSDPGGAARSHSRERDSGHALAGSSTLNRLELSEPDSASADRYKRIAVNTDALDELLVEMFVQSYDQPPAQIWLDLDATDDPLHGEQENRFFHGYYGHYCYLPLYIFSGEHLLCARLRPSNIDGAAGSVEELQRIVRQIREHWPDTGVNIRADSGFCRDEILSWCEAHEVGYVVGLAKNTRLRRMVAGSMAQAKAECVAQSRAARVFQEMRYRTLKSWSCERRVVGKAEYLPKGENPRFVVSNLLPDEVDARTLYEDLYCARGDMENRIKEQQLCLFADRTSTATMRGNQLRLYLASFAYVLMHGLRRLGLEKTQLRAAQCSTIRLKLLRVGARITISVRRIALSMTGHYSWAGEFEQALKNLRTHPPWSSPQTA